MPERMMMPPQGAPQGVPQGPPPEAPMEAPPGESPEEVEIDRMLVEQIIGLPLQVKMELLDALVVGAPGMGEPQGAPGMGAPGMGAPAMPGPQQALGDVVGRAVKGMR